MDIEHLRRRADIIRTIRAFFDERGYLEADTPALSCDLIPETCLEVFATEWITPSGVRHPLYLTPSPEIYLKPLIAQHKVSVFQLSKCYRNFESLGHIHSPEFTMLEYYTMNASYTDSALLTEELFSALHTTFSTPFIRLRMDDAFAEFAGFRLSARQTAAGLADEAHRMGIAEPPESPFCSWAWDDLYELILAHAVEPALPRDASVFLMDYPAQVPCLARDTPDAHIANVVWKERWELYCAGIEVANCYSEETDAHKVKAYFETEGRAKRESARVAHAINPDYWKNFLDFPECSGVALGVDRLIALLCGARTIESILPAMRF